MATHYRSDTSTQFTTTAIYEVTSPSVHFDEDGNMFYQASIDPVDRSYTASMLEQMREYLRMREPKPKITYKLKKVKRKKK